MVLSGVTPQTITAQLADFVLELRPSDLPEAVVHEALRILLDCVGCAVGGLVTDAGRIAVAVAAEERGPLQAQLIGGDHASLLPVVFANTVLTNALDFEPVGPEGHVCAVTVPVALAVADAVTASAQDLLVALLVGLELGGRVGSAIRRPAQGGAKVTPAVRGTAHAVFAAAAAAGRLLRLTPDQMTHAFGIAAYGATLPTLKKVMSGEHAPMTKYDHLGAMARNGVEAALLAQRGFTGDASVLEGDVGFWRFAGAQGCDWEALTVRLGESWTLGDTWFKRYPVILYATPGVNLVRRVVQENSVELEQIEEIEVRTMRTNRVQAGKEVATSMDAWTSYAYNVAAGLYDIHPWPAWQMRRTFERSDLQALTRKVELRALKADDMTTTGNYWEGWCPVRTTIRAGGRVLEGGQEYLPRIEDDELDQKFSENVQMFLEPVRAEQLREACWDLGGATKPSISSYLSGIERNPRVAVA